jgi:hypothetical protein
MQRFPRYCLLCTAALTMTVLAASLSRHLGNRQDAPRSLDDWDIRELADHLNQAGVKVQLQSSRKDGAFLNNAYLTTTHRDWEELMRLCIDPGPSRIHEWRGIVYCERAGEGKLEPPQWKDHLVVIGPFLFWGDVELLERIGAILVPYAAPAAP